MADCVGVDVQNRTAARPMSQRCTVPVWGHSFCDRPAAPNAPVAICSKHASEVWAFINDALGAADPFADQRTLSVIDRMAPDGLGEVVYYIRAGKYLKIGRTVDLRRRMYHYQPGVELVAVEPGGRVLEAQRHRQFKRLRVGKREWFLLGPELVEHVNEMTVSHGALLAA